VKGPKVDIIVDTKGKTANITFNFKDKSYKYITIYRDFGTDEIYFGKIWKNRDSVMKYYREFVMKYYVDIEYMLDKLEEFATLLGKDINQSFGGGFISQTFSDPFLDTTLLYNDRGLLKVKIGISKDIDKDNILVRIKNVC